MVLGFEDTSETTTSNTAETIVIGTTGIRPNTAVPPGVLDKTSIPETDHDTTGGPGAGAGTTYWYTATAPTDSADQTAAVSAPHFVLRFQNNAATNNGASAEYPENAYCTARSKML